MTAKNTLKKLNLEDRLKEAKLQEFKEQAKFQEGLNRLHKSADYQEFLLPKLQSAANNKWVDPTKFETKEAFFKAYTEAFGRAKAFQEIIDLLANSEAQLLRITKAMSGESKYEI